MSLHRGAQQACRQGGARAFAEAHGEIEQRCFIQMIGKTAVAGLDRKMGELAMIESGLVIGCQHGGGGATENMFFDIWFKARFKNQVSPKPGF